MERDPLGFGVLVGHRRGLLRDGLISLLRDTWPECQFLPHDCFEAVSNALMVGSVRLVLVELGLPGLNGVAGVRSLRALAPESGIVVLAREVSRETILSCLDSGAQGYIGMATTPQQLRSAVQAVLAGGVFAPAALTKRSASAPAVLRSSPSADPGCPASFSGRKRDVFELLTEGYSTKAIARRLDLSVGTVKVHLAAIYRELGAHSRLEAVTKARRHTFWREAACGVGSREPELTKIVELASDR